MILHELRYAVRRLRRRVRFTALLVGTLALGIGSTVAIFGVVYVVLVRPLPYASPDRLVTLWHRMDALGGQRARISGPDVAEYRAWSRTLTDVAFVTRTLQASLVVDGQATHLPTGVVSDNLFTVLGVPAAVGRTFRSGEARVSPAAFDDSLALLPPTPLIVSDRLWRARFGADSAVVGRSVELNGLSAVIIGVMPADFALLLPANVGFPTEADAWIPIRVRLSQLARAEGLRDQDSDNTGAVIARLATAATVERTRAELDAIAVRQRGDVPFYRDVGMRIEVRSLHDDVVGESRGVLVLLFAATALVLLIACANAASLLLARGVAEREDLALKIALGAGRVRLGREAVIESLLIAAAACGLGLVVAEWARGWLLTIAPAMPQAELAAPRGLLWAFAAGVAALCVVLVGLAPVHAQSGVAPADALRQRGGVTLVRSRLRRALIVAEIAVSLTLLIGAGLLVRSFAALQRVDTGFDARNVLVFSLSLRSVDDAYRGPARRAEFMQALASRVGALPGVTAVGAAGGMPLSGVTWTQPYGHEGELESEWGRREADFRVITSGYFDALDIRLLAGRGFTSTEDVVEASRVVIVDRLLAQELDPGGNVVGRRIGFPLDGRPVWAEIVGVVAPVRYTSLRERGRHTIYVPYRQEASRDIAVAVRGTMRLDDLESGIARELASLDPRLSMFAVQPMSAYVREALAPTTLALTLVSAFAVLALVLAAIGLYGVVTFAVSQRTREIGVRMALGARRWQVIGATLREGGMLAIAGVGVGLIVTVAASRVLGRVVFGVEPLDLTTYAVVSIFLILVSALACYVPARRAASIEPMEALRE